MGAVVVAWPAADDWREGCGQRAADPQVAAALKVQKDDLPIVSACTDMGSEAQVVLEVGCARHGGRR